MRGKSLTQARLKELLTYDPDTGVFRWSKRRGGVKFGGLCGRVSKVHGYLEICIDRELIRAHRLAFLYMTGRLPGAYVDHANRDKTDNRWANLREATMPQNMVNVGLRPNNTSGLVGVVWDKARGKWRAQIRLKGRKKNLGRYASAELAALAHDAAARREFGEFAQLNYPDRVYAGAN
jgi:Demerecviridae HNH endonuclease